MSKDLKNEITKNFEASLTKNQIFIKSLGIVYLIIAFFLWGSFIFIDFTYRITMFAGSLLYPLLLNGFYLLDISSYDKEVSKEEKGYIFGMNAISIASIISFTLYDKYFNSTTDYSLSKISFLLIALVSLEGLFMLFIIIQGFLESKIIRLEDNQGKSKALNLIMLGLSFMLNISFLKISVLSNLWHGISMFIFIYILSIPVVLVGGLYVLKRINRNFGENKYSYSFQRFQYRFLDFLIYNVIFLSINMTWFQLNWLFFGNAINLPTIILGGYVYYKLYRIKTNILK